MALVLGELLEHRQLVGLLETAQAYAHGACLRRHHHHGAVKKKSQMLYYQLWVVKQH